MGKWLWGFAIGHDSFCREVIVGKYGKMIVGWCSRESREACGTSV